jgi:hypothetical protein
MVSYVTTAHARNILPCREMWWQRSGRRPPGSLAICSVSCDAPLPWTASPSSLLGLLHSLGMLLYLCAQHTRCWPRPTCLGWKVKQNHIKDFGVSVLTGGVGALDLHQPIPPQDADAHLVAVSRLAIVLVGCNMDNFLEEKLSLSLACKKKTNTRYIWYNSFCLLLHFCLALLLERTKKN